MTSFVVYMVQGIFHLYFAVLFSVKSQEPDAYSIALKHNILPEHIVTPKTHVYIHLKH